VWGRPEHGWELIVWGGVGLEPDEDDDTA
jgi:hypothetical protein